MSASHLLGLQGPQRTPAHWNSYTPILIFHQFPCSKYPWSHVKSYGYEGSNMRLQKKPGLYQHHISKNLCSLLSQQVIWRLRKQVNKPVWAAKLLAYGISQNFTWPWCQWLFSKAHLFCSKIEMPALGSDRLGKFSLEFINTNFIPPFRTVLFNSIFCL